MLLQEGGVLFVVAGNRDDVAKPQREEDMSLGGHQRDASIDLPAVRTDRSNTIR